MSYFRTFWDLFLFFLFMCVCVCPYEYCTTCVRGAEEGRSCWIPDARVVRRLWDPCLELGSEPWSWWRTVHMLKHGATAPVPFLRTFRTSDLQLGFLNLFEVTKKLVTSDYLKSLPLSAFRADGPGDCSLLTLHSRFANASCQQLIGAPFLKIALKSRNTALTNHWALVCSSWPLRGQSCLKGNSNVLLSHSVAHHELQHIPRACLSNPSNFIIQPVLYQLNYLRWHIVVSLCAELESNQILCSPFFILIISVVNACRVDNTHLTFLKACG